MRKFRLFYKNEDNETVYVSIGKENKVSKFKKEATIFTDKTYAEKKILLDEKIKYNKFFVSDFGLVVIRNDKTLFFTENEQFEDDKNNAKIFDSEDDAMEKLIELKETLDVNDKMYIMKRLNDSYGWYIRDETTNTSLEKFELSMKLNSAINSFYALSDQNNFIGDDFVSLITKAIQLLK